MWIKVLILLIAWCAASNTPLLMHRVSACTQCGRGLRGLSGSWCESPCIPFEWDAAHVKGPDLASVGCAGLTKHEIYCFQGGGDLYAARTSGTPRPMWHLPARCEEGDVNALFQFRGAWHLMQQARPRPRTSIAHAVSADLLRFARLPDVLASGDSPDEQCFDGSASLVVKDGELTPMLMIDGGCGMKGPGSAPCMESTGNGSTGGVTAFPSDLSDVNLTTWDRIGPTVFKGCNGSAGPSPILKNEATGKLELIATHGEGEALFQATSNSLASWKMVHPTFLKQRGGGGGLWHPLPQNVDGIPEHEGRWATHIMQLNNPGGDGRATFALLKVDASTSRVVNRTAAVALDIGPGVKYGQLSNAGGTRRDGKAGDPRTIHVSWLASATGGEPCTAPDEGEGQLTSLRDLRFDPRLGPQGALVENPLEEYTSLRGELIDHTNQPIGTNLVQVLSLHQGSNSADLEVNLTLPVGSGYVLVGVVCNPTSMCCANFINITFGSAARGGGDARNVSMIVVDDTTSPLSSTAVFSLLGGEGQLPLRVMLDSRSVEVFAGFGRGVYAGPMGYHECPSGPCGVTIEASCGGVTASASAWEMLTIF